MTHPILARTEQIIADASQQIQCADELCATAKDAILRARALVVATHARITELACQNRQTLSSAKLIRTL